MDDALRKVGFSSNYLFFMYFFINNLYVTNTLSSEEDRTTRHSVANQLLWWPLPLSLSYHNVLTSIINYLLVPVKKHWSFIWISFFQSFESFISTTKRRTWLKISWTHDTEPLTVIVIGHVAYRNHNIIKNYFIYILLWNQDPVEKLY